MVDAARHEQPRQEPMFLKLPVRRDQVACAL